MSNLSAFLGRLLLAQVFLISGVGKLLGYAGTQAYMAGHGVSGMLLPFVIIVEIGGSILLILGWYTRWAAVVLAAFAILAALLFHLDLAEAAQRLQLMKDFAIAGGMLALAAYGAGTWSVDRN